MVCQVGARQLPLLTSSVTSAFTRHSNVRILYAYLMCEEAVKVATATTVQVQKMLRWRLLFARLTERSQGQGLCLHCSWPVSGEKKFCLLASGVYFESLEFGTTLDLSEIL